MEIRIYLYNEKLRSNGYEGVPEERSLAFGDEKLKRVRAALAEQW